MPYSLYRTRDGAGDSGPMSLRVRADPETRHPEYDRSSPRPGIGWCIMVGAIGARSYQMQDYWLTTPVTEIVSDEPNKVVFRTGNSEYTWTEF